jgi:SPP1 gp7 family putative phage head morphogenesis protein
MGSPILPRTLSDPTQQDSRERRAMADFKSRMRAIQRGMLRILDQQTYQVVTINAMQHNATTYRFELDENVLGRINQEIATLIDGILLEGGERNLWFMDAYVSPAYQQGTGQSVTNLATQSTQYAVSRPNLESVLLSEPYRKRIGLLRARVFEEMKGLSDAMRGDLGSTLTRGMVAGQNPRDIAKTIKDRIGVSQSRANTIARTEIPNAFRQARMDEADNARETLGIRTMELHLSALSPTTRPDHAARHGTLHTVQDQRQWWAVSGRSVNCKCSTISVLVNDSGEPLIPSIVERAKKMRS